MSDTQKTSLPILAGSFGVAPASILIAVPLYLIVKILLSTDFIQTEDIAVVWTIVYVYIVMVASGVFGLVGAIQSLRRRAFVFALIGMLLVVLASLYGSVQLIGFLALARNANPTSGAFIVLDLASLALSLSSVILLVKSRSEFS